jgi:sortase (surface protein transpeptidase)
MNTAELNYYYPYYPKVVLSRPSLKNRLMKRAAFGVGIIGIVLMAFSYLPFMWNSVVAQEENARQITVNQAPDAYEPAFDASLPFENKLIIPSIGVETVLHESSLSKYEDALVQGVWRVTDYGTPNTRDYPTILVAHRFGYLKWSNEYRRKNSFYNLPKLEEGDVISINFRQRKYQYAIYKVEKGTEITDYSADLILYTCMDLTSDVKFVVYAKLLEV